MVQWCGCTSIQWYGGAPDDPNPYSHGVAQNEPVKPCCWTIWMSLGRVADKPQSEKQLKNKFQAVT